MIFESHFKLRVVAGLIFCTVALPFLAFAAARSAPFAPGETLDPGAASVEPCGPTDANCFPAILSTSDEGGRLSQNVLHLNFVGSGVTATHSGATTTVTISSSGITGLGNGMGTTTATTILIATSSASSNGLTLSLTADVSSGTITLTPNLSGVLTAQGGGTGWGSIASGTLLTGNGTGAVSTTTIGSGLQLTGGVLSATLSTTSALSWGALQTFSSGLISQASSTIGGGTQVTGLNISGGATTTGLLHVTGVGTSTFTGGITTSGSTGGYHIDGNLVLQASSTNFSTLVGIGQPSLGSGSLYNTALGYQALGNSTSSSVGRNVAIGYQALRGNASNALSTFNIAVGFQALTSNSTGSGNVALGQIAGSSNTTGSSNVALGFQSLVSNTTGGQNTALGRNTLYYVTGSNNVALGMNAGVGVSPAAYDNATLLGAEAGAALSTGSGNILLGYGAGNNLTTGSNNIILGYDIDAPAISSANTLNIGNVLFGTGLNATGGTLDVDARIGIGSTTPMGRFSIHALNGDTATSLFVIGSSTAISTSTLFSVSNTGQVVIGGTASSTIGQLSVMAGTTTIRHAGSPFTTLPGTVRVQGNYAYVTNTQGGRALTIYDISTPSAPTQVSTISAGLSDPFGVYVQGRYAYVANRGNHTLAIFDVSNPASPFLVSTTTSGLNTPLFVNVQGKYAYVTSTLNNSLVIFDISNPTAPVFMSSISNGLSTPSSVEIRGNYAYVTSTLTNILVIFDVSNPSIPVRVGSLSGSNGKGVTVQGRYAYVADQASNVLRIIDISNPASPTQVGTQTSGISQPYGVIISGRYVLVVNGDFTDGSLAVVDVSTPSAPLLVSRIYPSLSSISSAFTIAIQGRHAYMTNWTNSRLEVFDLGGAYIQQLEAGSIEAGSLLLRNDLSASYGDFRGGLSVGNSLAVTGSGSFLHIATTSLSGQVALSAMLRDNNTSSVGDVLSISKTATGTIAAGIGSGLVFTDEYSNTPSSIFVRQASSSARIASVLTSISTSTPAADLAFYTKSIAGTLSERMRLTSAGLLGIGTTTPGFALHVIAATSTDVAKFESSSGGTSCTLSGTTGIINCTSDARLKDNITAMQSTSSLSAVLALKPSSYTWKAVPDAGTQAGFIAQDIELTLPGLVRTDSVTGYKGISMIGMMPYVVGATQEMYQRMFGTSTTDVLFPEGIAPALASLASLSASTTVEEKGEFKKTFLGAFFDRLASWFADSANGIATFFVGELRTESLCVGETCVSESQLQDLLNGRSSSRVESSALAPTPEPEPEAPAPESAPASSSDNAPNTSDTPEPDAPDAGDTEAGEATAQESAQSQPSAQPESTSTQADPAPSTPEPTPAPVETTPEPQPAAAPAL